MELDLREVVSGNRKKLDISENIDLSKENIFCDKPVSIKGQVFLSADVLKLKAEISAEITKPCDRCLNLTTKKYDIPLNKVLVTESEEDNDDYILIPGYRLDIKELCRSEILLHISFLHLCSEDCLGICANCGKNLNEGHCDCAK